MKTFCATNCEICGKARSAADHKECSKLLQQSTASRKARKAQKTIKTKHDMDYLAKL